MSNPSIFRIPTTLFIAVLLAMFTPQQGFAHGNHNKPCTGPHSTDAVCNEPPPPPVTACDTPDFPAFAFSKGIYDGKRGSLSGYSLHLSNSDGSCTAPRFSSLWGRRPRWDRAGVSTRFRDCGRLGGPEFPSSDARAPGVCFSSPTRGRDSGSGRLCVGFHTGRAGLLPLHRLSAGSAIDGSGGADRRSDPPGERRQRLFQLGAHLRKPGCSRLGRGWIRLGDDAQPVGFSPPSARRRRSSVCSAPCGGS